MTRSRDISWNVGRSFPRRAEGTRLTQVTYTPSTTMNSPQEPASPSPSTPSSGSPPPDENISHSTALSSSHQLPSPGQIKRRLVSGSAVYGRDLKSRRRDETSAKKPFVQEHSGRENRKDELVDIDLMEKLKLGSFNTF